MEAFARAPEPLADEPSMDKTWRMWKQEFTIFLSLAGLDDKSSDAKANLLLNTIGKLGIKAVQDMEFEDPENDKKNYEILLQKFDDFYDPPKRETEERFRFYTRLRRNNEPIEAYINDLKEKAKTCNFADMTESLIRDMVILHMKDENMRKLMFEEKNLDLNKLTLLCRQYELQTDKMKDVSKKAVNENTTNTCWRCRTTHAPRKCPAFHTTCEKCNEKGHFTQQCNVSKARANNNPNPNNLNINKNINKNKSNTKSPFNQLEKNKSKN